MTTAELLCRYALGERDFRGAILRGADLAGAILRDADLAGADLRGAVLTKANLRDASLTKANLHEANLAGANLIRADLHEANLAGANLTWVNLTGAILAGTCLDPMARPNGDTTGYAEYTSRSGVVWCVGYRTPRSPYMGSLGYEVGKAYRAPWFSVAPTDCHPGLYVRAKRKPGDITVVFRKIDAHRAGDKTRVTEFVT
jgi:hypothetical protein